MSGSYDCTIRRTNLRTGESEEILDLDRFDDNEALVHAFDFAEGGEVLWASDHNGGLTRRDLREPIESAVRWNISENGVSSASNKVGCLSICSANPRLAVTSHLKRYIK